MVLFKYIMKHIDNINQEKFTFHYGPIQIMIMQNLYLNFTNLHSTMVLFKLEIGCIKIHLNRFTFHYGPIQIMKRYLVCQIGNNLHSTMVLFKLSQK